MNMTKTERNNAAAAAAAAADESANVFVSGLDIGSSIEGAASDMETIAARMRVTLQKANIIRSEDDLPEWKKLEALLELARNDGRIKFDRASIVRGIVQRCDHDAPASNAADKKKWVSFYTSLGLANGETFHAMNTEAQKSLAGKNEDKLKSVKEFRNYINGKASNRWTSLRDADERMRREENGKTTGARAKKTPRESIGVTQVSKLPTRIKNLREDGVEFPQEIIHAVQTLVAWVEGKKLPKSTVVTTASDVTPK